MVGVEDVGVGVEGGKGGGGKEGGVQWRHALQD